MRLCGMFVLPCLALGVLVPGGALATLLLAAAAGAAAAAGPAAELALFLPESRRDVKPRDSMFLEVVPSFRAMVFCRFSVLFLGFQKQR